MDDARTVELQELRVDDVIINVEPKIFHQHGKLLAIVECCRHKVIVEVGTYVFHLVAEVEVVGQQEVVLQPLVEFVGVRRWVESIFIIREDCGTEVVFATRYERKPEESRNGQHQNIFSNFHNQLALTNSPFETVSCEAESDGRLFGSRPADITSAGIWMARRSSSIVSFSMRSIPML